MNAARNTEVGEERAPEASTRGDARVKFTNFASSISSSSSPPSSTTPTTSSVPTTSSEGGSEGDSEGGSRRRKVVVVGNCQQQELATHLRQWDDAHSRALDIHEVVIFLNLDAPSVLDVVDDADVVVCRNVKKDVAAAFTPAAIRARVQPGCTVIVMEFVHFDGFDPVPREAGAWFWGREARLVHERPPVDVGTWAEFCALDLDPAVIHAHFQASCDALKRTDETSDLKVYDFFMARYKTQRLFRTDAHITRAVYRHLLAQLLSLLGLHEEVELVAVEDRKQRVERADTRQHELEGDEDDEDVSLIEGAAVHYHPTILFPCIKRALGLQFSDSGLRDYLGSKCSQREMYEFSRAVQTGALALVSWTDAVPILAQFLVTQRTSQSTCSCDCTAARSLCAPHQQPTTPAAHLAVDTVDMNADKLRELFAPTPHTDSLEYKVEPLLHQDTP